MQSDAPTASNWLLDGLLSSYKSKPSNDQNPAGGAVQIYSNHCLTYFVQFNLTRKLGFALEKATPFALVLSPIALGSTTLNGKPYIPLETLKTLGIAYRLQGNTLTIGGGRR